MKPTKIESLQRLNARRAAHHAALETLRASSCKTPGVKLWRSLRRLERIVHDATTAQCNGESYGSAPFRSPFEWEAFKGQTLATIKHLFGHVPPGFFVNGDARGHALKIDPDKVTVPHGMETDLGGSGILAAEINQ